MMSIWRAMVLGLCLSLPALGAPAEENTVQMFSLEAAHDGRVYGAFECRTGRLVEVKGAVYRVEIPGLRQVSLVDMKSGRVFGPYDFVDGRLARIGDEMYSFVDIRDVAVPPSVAPAVPPVEPPRTPEPAPEPRPVTPPPAPPASASEPQALPKPPPPPSVEPPPKATPPPPIRAPAPRVRPPAARAEPPPAPRVLPPAAPPAPALRVTAGVAPLLDEDYDWSIEGASAAESAPVSRHEFFLAAGRGDFAVEAGFLYDSSVDELAGGGGASYWRVRLSEGSGWRATLRYEPSILRRGPWDLRLTAAGTHRRETYTLTYNTLQVVGTAVGFDTNSQAVVQTLYAPGAVTDEAVLAESELHAGALLRYTARDIEAWGAARALAADTIDLTADLRSGGVTRAMGFERAGRITVAAGAAARFAGLRWHVEAATGAEQSVRVGMTRSF